MANDLLDREQQAGNESDHLNLAQKNSDATFNKKNAPQQEIDEDFDNIIANNYGGDKAKEKVDAHGDKIQSNYNADPIADVKDKEEAGGPSLYNSSDKGKQSFWGGISGKVKKHGPTASVAGLLIGGFSAVSMLFMPAALLAVLEKAMTNDGSDSTRTNLVMRRAYMGSMLGKGDCSSKVKCKLTAMSDKQKARWEKNGFKMETTQENGRHKVTSITSPDGKTKMTSGAEFNKWAESSLENRKLANRVVNTRAAFFQNSKFKKVLAKFKIDKSKILKSSKDKDKAKRTEAINKSFNENIDTTQGDRDTRIKGHQAKTTESSNFKSKLNNIASKTGKGSSISTITAIGCATYNTVRLTTATVKAKWIYDLIKFAYPFIQAASQIEDQGNIEPEVVENLADRLTWYQNDATTKRLADAESDPAKKQEINDKKNLTAMDSQGIEMAVYGDFEGLKKFTEKYTTGYIGATIALSSTVKYVQNLIGKDNIHNVCVGNAIYGLASSAFCLLGPWSLAACVAAVVAVAAFADDALKLAVEELSDDALALIADANLTSDLKGVDAGNALAAGVGLMLSTTSMGYGLRPASSPAKVKQFITATDNLNYEYGEELARYEAKDTPFDIYNQYSFAGQLVLAFNPYRSSDKTVYSQLANTFAAITAPLSKALPTANALYNQPSNMTLKPDSHTNRIDKCNDQDMHDIGAVCDWSGRMIGYTSPEVLEQSTKQAAGSEDMIIKTIDYMIGHRYIKDDGSVDESNDRNEYKKYKEYCTEDRVDPLGTSSQRVEEGDDNDQKWFTGERCLGKDDGNQAEQDMLNKFAIYFNYCESQVPTADEVENCWTDTTAAAAPATNIQCGTNWGYPITKNGTTITRGMGGGHEGADIFKGSPGVAGMPVYAACDGEVTHAGGGVSGFGYWVIIKHEVNGQRIDTLYGHTKPVAGISVGTRVTACQQIGETASLADMASNGGSGGSTGPHLHFEYHPGGYRNPADPVPILNSAKDCG